MAFSMLDVRFELFSVSVVETASPIELFVQSSRGNRLLLLSRRTVDFVIDKCCVFLELSFSLWILVLPTDFT